MCTIYRAENKLNGKSYVGFDCNWPYRKTAHKSAAKRGSELHFHRAIRAHGWDNFEWSILEQSENKEYLLNERENFWINHFNTFGENGYNMTLGGDATFGWHPSDETKEKIAASKRGKPSWNKGLPSPWTVQENIRRKGSKSPNRQKEYIITNPQGECFRIKGLIDFCKENKLHAGNMVSVAKGNLNHYKHWLCEYAT